ncbi:MAG TPA: L-aspartate oxidase [Sedimentisphaerales bacterium]|nr:L-aspartate oxidase [Sedimentisphaerales bacterium]
MPTGQVEFRRYLRDIDSISMPQFYTDVAVIGTGIAGLRAAIEAGEKCNVTLICKAGLEDSNTWNAQGGIAVALGRDDSIESHIADTLKVGCGLCDEKIVRLVISEGPALVRQLLEWGTEFDLADGRIDVTYEGGHSHPRVAHALGDSTGKGILLALIRKIRENPRIKVMENLFVTDIITGDTGECIGVVGQNSRHDGEIIWAAKTILATGGAGRLYRETTNPQIATGDGLAIAYRAGAVLRDMEFMQFHPTTLYIAGASRALISETVRGEGGRLLDASGCRFMQDYHPSAEMAPRDVVSRAILEQMLKTNATHVYVDVRHIPKERFAKRFPAIHTLCASFDIDVSKDLIPVRPSAHYMLGGIRVDEDARTNIPNLYACGEVTSTGLHGANRLGSNSLLEGLVFGKIAGASAAKGIRKAGGPIKHRVIKYNVPSSDRSRLDTGDIVNSLRALMWRNVGIIRRLKPLQEAIEIIRFWQRYVMDKAFDAPAGWECQNMLTVAMLMAQAALTRQESRGVHCREDFPERDDAHFSSHIEEKKGSGRFPESLSKTAIDAV